MRAGDYVMIVVTDTGTGMPPEIIERVFEPFFTTKEVGQGHRPRPQHGLRLRQAVRRPRKIYSEVGRGTSIKLYLPRADKQTQSPQPPHPRCRRQ